MNQLLLVAILALCNGALAITLTKGTIFRRVREAIIIRSNFFGELVQCPYCTSHWLAFAGMIAYHPRLLTTNFVVGDYFVTTFALVCLSAISAGAIYKLFASNPVPSE